MNENLKNSVKLALDALESCIMSNYGKDWIWPQSAHETAMINVKEAYKKLKESSAYMFYTYPNFIGDAIKVESKKNDDTLSIQERINDLDSKIEQSMEPASQMTLIDKNKPLNTDMNAERWAKEFVELNGGDEDLMRSWFANALMCGWDNHYWTTDEYKKSIKDALNQA